MTEFLKTNISVGDTIKVVVGILIPSIIFGLKLDARISMLELRVNKLEDKLERMISKQEILYEQNQEILADIKYIRYVLKKEKS